MMASTSLWAAGVRVLFDPSKPEVGPFPTDYLTAPATNTKTARMVRMPAPGDCNALPNACQEAWLASSFDGFHPQGRVRIRFSGPINPDTIAGGVLLVASDNLTTDEVGVHKTGDTVKLNQIIYDPATDTAYGKPDGPMDQHRRYLLVVTDAVKDTAGDAVEADPAYTNCANGASDEYCSGLSAAVKNAAVTGKVAAASVYSTMSVTAWLEKALAQLNNLPPTVTGAGFFTMEDMRKVTWRIQTGASATAFTDIVLPIELIQSGLKGLGFGTFQSNVHMGPDRVIPTVASNDPLPSDVRQEELQYAVYLPNVEKPSPGYPVVIYGHGMGDSRFGGPALVGATLARSGLATIAINAVGHGFGPNSRMLISTASKGEVEVMMPGRGIDMNSDGRIDSSEGCMSLLSAPFGLRDCLRQTAVDLAQLVRVIKAGIDVDGDGTVDLDPGQIFYVGQSLGSLYGTMLLAVDGTVQAAALNSGGGPVIDIQRWGPAFRPLGALNLSFRRPMLLNNGSDFDESYVLRNQPAKIVTTAGAIDIQNAFEMQEWIQAEGDPALFASHLKLSPLAGVTGKKVLWLFGKGDQTIPNNTASTLVRNAGMQDSTWLYRHDLARQHAPLPADPHEYLTWYVGASSTTLNLFARPIANATQSQIAQFFKTGEIADPNTLDSSLFFFFPPGIFEKPATLPEDLNYLEQ